MLAIIQSIIACMLVTLTMFAGENRVQQSSKFEHLLFQLPENIVLSLNSFVSFGPI